MSRSLFRYPGGKARLAPLIARTIELNGLKGRVYTKTFNVVSRETMDRVVQAIEDRASERGFCASVCPETIAQNDNVLIPKRYIDHEFVDARRSYKDIAADYNRVIRAQNAVSLYFPQVLPFPALFLWRVPRVPARFLGRLWRSERVPLRSLCS